MQANTLFAFIAASEKCRWNFKPEQTKWKKSS